MTNPYGLRIGWKYLVSYTGMAVHRPDVGGFGVISVAGYRNLVRRVEGFEKVTPLIGQEGTARPWDLTARELSVLPPLAEGCTNRQIAEKLGISPDTVNTFLGRISTKLDAHNRMQIVVKAIRFRLLEVDRIG